MSIGIGGYRDLPPGNLKRNTFGGNTRAPGENEPEVAGSANEELDPKILAGLKKFISDAEMFGHANWPPAEILKNKKLKDELVRLLHERTKNFPYTELEKYLRKLQISGTKI